MSLIDPSVLSAASDDELGDAIMQLHGVMAAAHARLLGFLGEHSRREAYRADGAASSGEWLCTRLNLARPTAMAWADCAAKLADLPAMEAVFGAGGLSFDQLEPLARVAGSADDSYLAMAAPAWSAAQCRLYARRCRPVTTADANESHARRSLALRKCRDGGLRISGFLDPEGGAVVEHALSDRAEQAAPDPSTGLFEPYDQRRADALVELVAAGHHAADPGRATVVVHVDAEVLAATGRTNTEHGPRPSGARTESEGGAAPDDEPPSEPDPAGAAEAEGGQGLAGETARRLACDCIWNLVAEGADDQPLRVAKARRSAPAWLRRELRRRDPTCRFPGCERTLLLHAHHIQHWASGGRTEPGNLVFLCNRHHRFVHEEHWVISGDPGGVLCFASPQGRSFTSRTVPLRPALSKRLFGPLGTATADHPPENPNAP